MTPEQARRLLNDALPGPWQAEPRESVAADPDNVYAAEKYIIRQEGTPGIRFNGTAHGTEAINSIPLIAAAPEMAETIAGMHAEYAVQGKAPNSDKWVALTQWAKEPPPSEFELEVTLTDEDTGETHRIDARIVARYVTNPQPLGDQP